MNGQVYVLLCDGFAKIGFSVNTKSRLATAQNMNPHKVSLICSVPGTEADERDLHKRFKQYRHKGEWFRFEGDLKEWADSLSVTWPPCAFREWTEAERGRKVWVANAIGVTAGTISQWSHVPTDRIIEIERHTGIPRQELRPDLYEGMEPSQ